MAKLRFLDSQGLSFFKDKIVNLLNSHTSNNNIHTSIEEKSKLEEAYNHSTSLHAPTDAEKNIIVGVKKNGEDLLIDEESRIVDIIVPWKQNTIDSEGYVPRGEGQINKVWGTDKDGNPMWIDKNNIDTWGGYSISVLSESEYQELDSPDKNTIYFRFKGITE